MSDPISEIKEKLDIVDIIGGYVQLKKSGTNFKGLCPFHHEKSGSLMVSSTKQIFHCFGCGEGGDVIEFVKKIDNISFPEALQILADKAGIVLPDTRVGGPKKEVTEQAYKINSFAAKFYHSILMGSSGKQALEYLTKRGLKLDTVKKWQIGFAPDSFSILKDQLLQKGVTEQELLQAGVTAKSDKGRTYDRFRNRITFPIVDFLGKFVGFSARDFSGAADMAKYINSPDTVVYNKSRVLFGLNFAKQEARLQDKMVVVEGQMDCIQAQQAGFLNTVATSGTALTLDHLKLIGRLTKNLIYCFDQDLAGREAAKKAGMLALSNGFTVKMVEFSGAKDPDELILQDPKLWQKALDEAVWFIDHFIKLGLSQFAFGSVEQKKYVSQELLPLLQILQDPIEREHYTSLIAQNYDISASNLKVVPVAKTTQAPTEEAEQLGDSASSSLENTEKEILGGLLYFPELRSTLLPKLNLKVFSLPVVVEGIELLQKGQIEAINPGLSKEVLFMVEFNLEQNSGNQSAYMRELERTYKTLQLSSLKISLQRLTNLIKQAEARGERVELEKLNREYAIKLAERSTLELAD